MPAIVAGKVDGKGNGVRTVLPNHDIAKALERTVRLFTQVLWAGSRNSDSNGETIPQEVCIIVSDFI